MLVLAVDAPTIRLSDIEPLLLSAERGAAFEGMPLPMVVDIAALPSDAAPGWALARLVERAGLARLPCPPEAQARLRGANTPEERDALLASEAAQKGGAG